MEKRIYLAGGLFNAGERLHNLYLEKALKELGYKVILPQREDLKHCDSKKGFDLPSIAEDYIQPCPDTQNIFVGNLDDAGSDSLTRIKNRATVQSTKRAIYYLTDLRTNTEKEVVVNARLYRGGETVFIYDPCHFTELDQVESYYQGLAEKINEVINHIIKVKD